MKSFVRVHDHPRVKTCANILRHKTFLPHPDWFKMHGIPLVKIVQKPGEYIVTFPKGYHFGVNLGFCINEAVNVAIPSWINWGKVAGPKCSCPEELVIFMNFFHSCDKFNQLLYKYFFFFCHSDEEHHQGGCRISMVPFVRKFQSDRFEKWLKGEEDEMFPANDRQGAAPKLPPAPTLEDLLAMSENVSESILERIEFLDPGGVERRKLEKARFVILSVFLP